MTPLRLGTRGSRLAHAQAALAAGALRAAGLGPVAIVPISTAGDRDRRSAFSELGGAGRVLQGARGRAPGRAHRRGRALGQGPHDGRDARGSMLAAVLPRADARDAWCGPHASLAEVPRRCARRHGVDAPRRPAGRPAARSARREPARQRGHATAQARRARARRRRARGLRPRPPRARDEIGFRVEVDEMLPETGPGLPGAAGAQRGRRRAWRRSATRAARACCRPSAPARRCSAAAAARPWRPRGAAGRRAALAARLARAARTARWSSRPRRAGTSPSRWPSEVAGARSGAGARRSSRRCARDGLPRRRRARRSPADHGARRGAPAAGRCDRLRPPRR